MTLVLPSVVSRPITIPEFEGNYAHIIALLGGYVPTGDSRLSDARTPLSHTHPTSAITGLDTALGLRALSADVTAALALKVSTGDASVSNARAIADAAYGLFTVTGGVAAINQATPTEMYAGTAGKGVGAAGLYAISQPSTVAPAAGVLTLNWTAANIPTLNAICSVTQNITSMAISNLPLWRTVAVLFELTGPYTIVVPAHGATVDGLTFYRIDNAVWPSFPAANGAAVIIAFTRTATCIYCGLAGMCTAP